MTTFASMVSRLKKPDLDILNSLRPGDGDLIHMGMGVSKEGGELLDAICKWIIYRKPLDRENMIEEIGDTLFFIEGLCQTLGITVDQCILANMAKLQKRYPSGCYTNQDAIARQDKLEPASLSELPDPEPISYFNQSEPIFD